MDRTIEYIITKQDLSSARPGSLTVEQFLRRRGYSAHTLARLRQMPKSTLIDGSPVILKSPLAPGSHLTVCIHETTVSAHVKPVDLPLEIVYEDEDLVVVNKPAGMPTHPSYQNRDNSLASALAWYYQAQGKPFVFRCCNRLDKDTSGLTLVAKHFLSGSLLSESGRRRQIRREYIGIVKGSLTDAGLVPDGTIDVPLSRKSGSILERIPDPEHGERAVTHYHLITEKNGYSLLSFILETGRTHQIRIHMKSIGFPLVGDYLYNPEEIETAPDEEPASAAAETAPGEESASAAAATAPASGLHRQALHAYRLSFSQPVTGAPLSFTAPLPEDMARLLR